MPLRITVYTNFPSSFPTLSPTHCSQTSACTLSLRPASQGLQPNAKPNSYFHLSRCARSFWHRWPLFPSRNSPVLDLKYLVWPSSLLDLPLLLWTPFCSLLTGYFFPPSLIKNNIMAFHCPSYLLHSGHSNSTLNIAAQKASQNTKIRLLSWLSLASNHSVTPVSHECNMALKSPPPAFPCGSDSVFTRGLCLLTAPQKSLKFP